MEEPTYVSKSLLTECCQEVLSWNNKEYVSSIADAAVNWVEKQTVAEVRDNPPTGAVCQRVLLLEGQVRESVNYRVEVWDLAMGKSKLVGLLNGGCSTSSYQLEV